MNTNVISIKCNFCSATIPARNTDGASTMATPGQPTDACAECAQKDFAFLSTKYAAPPTAQRPQPQRIKLANGQETFLPPGAPLPPGATVVPR